MRFHERMRGVRLAPLMEQRDQILVRIQRGVRQLEGAAAMTREAKRDWDWAHILAVLAHHYRPGDPTSKAPTLRAVEDALRLLSLRNHHANFHPFLKKLALALSSLGSAVQEARTAGVALEWGPLLALLAPHTSKANGLDVGPAVDAIAQALGLQVWSKVLRDTRLWHGLDVLPTAQWEALIRDHATPLAEGLDQPWLRLLHARVMTEERPDVGAFYRWNSWNLRAGCPVALGRKLELKTQNRTPASLRRGVVQLAEWMRFLAGGPDPDAKPSLDRIEAAWDKQAPLDLGVIQVAFRPGVMVLTFTRADLVALTNQLVALTHERLDPVPAKRAFPAP